MTSLFPGYKQVESFGPDEDYEEEVEECYLTFDFDDVDPALIPNSETYRLIGLDTPTPFLQLSGTILKGTPQTLLGTQLVFKDGSSAADGGNNDDIEGDNHNVRATRPVPPPPTSELGASRDVRVPAEVVHVCNTRQRIRFREVKLKPKNTQPPTAPLIDNRDELQRQDGGSMQTGDDGGSDDLERSSAQQSLAVQENFGGSSPSGMEMEVDTETS